MCFMYVKSTRSLATRMYDFFQTCYIEPRMRDVHQFCRQVTNSASGEDAFGLETSCIEDLDGQD
jgi:hypothetical protein